MFLYNKKIGYRLTAIFLLSILIGYCIFHSFFSSNSLLHVGQLKKDLLKAQQFALELDGQINSFNLKISLIHSDECPDLDFLEEEAKKKLGFAHKKEVIFIMDFLLIENSS